MGIDFTLPFAVALSKTFTFGYELLLRQRREFSPSRRLEDKNGIQIPQNDAYVRCCVELVECLLSILLTCAYQRINLRTIEYNGILMLFFRRLQHLANEHNS